MNRTQYLKHLLSKRMLVLDGAMGTMIQKQNLSDEDFVFEEKRALGCNELLNLSRGDVIFSIHTQYLDAGADIIETNTFCANAFNLEEYNLVDEVEIINQAACEIAREAAADFESRTEGYAFVAGVLGPTNRALSFSTKVEDPAYRQSEFSDFLAMYRQQAKVLLAGGVDLLLIETVFDTLVAKSAIIACLEEMESQQRTIPLMVSVTFSDQSRRTLSGQTLQAFVASLSAFPLFSLGLNCSTGPDQMIPLLEELSVISPFYVSAHPNAGFPDKDGVYTLTAEAMASQLLPLLQRGSLNILGGCCGTTPLHIQALKEASLQATVREKQTTEHALLLSGLDVCRAEKDALLIVGERTNVAGSRKFARLIKQEKWEEALQIARSQVQEGARVLDVCMDASMLDAKKSMVQFLRHLGSDPSVAKVPLMIDSSDWSVIEAALSEVQGRGIVNSISLKEGEALFVSRAKEIARHGHAMVVMLFDEEGQAVSYERKISIAERSHTLLKKAGIRDQDIIFDANVLSIATGIEEHDTYARDFIQATKTLKQLYPYCHTSAGVSNLSFSFRGNDALRSAMHAVFLELADLDMAIINPASLQKPSALDREIRTTIEQALLAQEDDLSEVRSRLIALAIEMQPQQEDEKPKVSASQKSPSERLYDAVLNGQNDFLAQDLTQLSEVDPIQIVEGPLMDGMKEVGRLFGQGKLFLPQVVRSARTMKLAVDILQPRIEAILDNNVTQLGNQKKRTAVMATVKGDVHDIGKNIVNLILKCNGFEVVDLGVMVQAKTILQAAKEHEADLVGLSGLITPSLKEMEHVITLFEEHKVSVPIFIGGATTSELHTAVKLAVLTSQPVLHTKDASAMAIVANEVMGKNRNQFLFEVALRYEKLRSEHQGEQKTKQADSYSYDESLKMTKQKVEGSEAKEYGIHTLEKCDIDQLVQKINYKMYCAAWKVPYHSDEGKSLVSQAKDLLAEPSIKQLFENGCKLVYGTFKAKSDRFRVGVEDSSFYFLRNEQNGLCLADAIAIEDTIGLFVSTASLGMEDYYARLEREGKIQRLLSLKLLSDRLAEALADEAETLIRQMWDCEQPMYLRPAPGYPSWSDHSEKQTLFSLLGATEKIGVHLTESFAMNPPSSVCGMLIGGENLRYFSLGPIGEKQLQMYAQAKGLSSQQLATLLSGMEY
ncbi:MAG: methionine synthase [Spirochaetia bacterium]|nr:methionine synthase [Spirochaetia bacterium]